MVDIVAAGPDDWALVRDVRLRALADSPDSFGVVLAEASTQPEHAWRARLDRPDPTLVAVLDGAGVGMGGGFAPDGTDRAWIWGMWTDPAVRGRGVGELLVRECLDRARAAGKRRMVLSTDPRMVAAHRLYERRGFTRLPERDWSPLPGVSLMAYAREL